MRCNPLLSCWRFSTAGRAASRASGRLRAVCPACQHGRSTSSRWTTPVMSHPSPRRTCSRSMPRSCAARHPQVARTPLPPDGCPVHPGEPLRGQCGMTRLQSGPLLQPWWPELRPRLPLERTLKVTLTAWVASSQRPFPSGKPKETLQILNRPCLCSRQDRTVQPSGWRIIATPWRVTVMPHSVTTLTAPVYGASQVHRKPFLPTGAVGDGEIHIPPITLHASGF